MSVTLHFPSKRLIVFPVCEFRYILAELVGTEVEYVTKLETLVEVSSSRNG